MTTRRKWTAIPGFLALAAAATVVSAYSGASSSQYNSPEQPVRFPHPRHAGAVNTQDPSKGGLGMNCVYCHYSSNKGLDPGMPAVSTCMGCHTVIKTNSPQIQKLTAYWNAKLPVPWVRIHKVPDYVQFPHMRHVGAGVTCQSCHGQVQNMDVVYQYASLNMGWCINCHVNGYQPAEGARLAGVQPTPQEVAAAPKKARYDCANCHY